MKKLVLVSVRFRNQMMSLFVWTTDGKVLPEVINGMLDEMGSTPGRRETYSIG